MSTSYWDRIKTAFKATPPKEFQKLSEQMYQNLQKRLKNQGWYDREDIETCLFTAVSSGEVIAFGINPQAKKVKKQLDREIDQQDLVAISRALYLEVEGKRAGREDIEQEDINASLQTVLRASA